MRVSIRPSQGAPSRGEDKRVRVLFLTLYPEPAASPRYRVMQFLPHLRANGIECVVAPALTAEQYARYSERAKNGSAAGYHVAEFVRRVGQILGARSFDLVFVQKAILSVYVKRLSALLSWRARKVVYDIDDAVNVAAPNRLTGIWSRLEDPGQINKVMAASELVLAGNEWLRSVAEAAGAHAELFPTVVDTERFVPTDDSPERFTVGWMGNPSTCEHLNAIGDVLEGLDEAEVRVIGGDANRMAISGAAHAAWRLESEVAELQRFSVGVMPLPKDEWSRGKCALKALQYMACGVPCVATPFGAVRSIIEHEKNGLFADSPEEWIQAFDRLRDDGYRATLGAAARETVVKSFSLHSAAPRLVELLRSVA